MSTITTLVFSPLIQFPKPKSFSTSKLNFRSKFTFLSRDKKYPYPNMADLVRSQASVGDDGVGVKIGGFEQEAFIDGSSISATGGLNATLNKLSKWLVAAVFGIIFLWRHDAEALWAASGSVLNAWLSTVLKRILNQERPVSTLRSDPGMPSSHAQSIIYAATFCIVSIVEYFGLNGITAVISALIFAIGSYFSWLRVSQRLHTTSQVAVGAVLGFSFSVFWFWLWDAIVLKAFISHLWVRLIIVLGTAAICVSFLLYVVRYWVLEEN
ncbi:PREDICTED: lipid phosphate phosphatase epsilon 2, chloroplastic isoform X1 [Nicotiana attenuata]|uniref:Lipid phosphate phosphatase epsilon 2, chloroplastic n=1 Tax=Nicotiana attenuata TaxID=49451 RepID=A0A314KL40_NICAT|nr:PREDICTED: lipid phosphate phosphatase epsilon 2, chloroplastic isoform X1 [Nicotiana attenuata]OIT29902.1 lipid phosphate phosphatase epsilon 2, chloroplastic [Nicotiana attenuata]